MMAVRRPAQPLPGAAAAVAHPDYGNVRRGWGIICGTAASPILPIVLGPVGILLGAVGVACRERLAPFALGLSVVGTVAGMLLGAWVGAHLWGR